MLELKTRLKTYLPTDLNTRGQNDFVFKSCTCWQSFLEDKVSRPPLNKHVTLKVMVALPVKTSLWL